MAIGSWVVSSVIRFSTNGPIVMQRLAASTQAANTRLSQQLGLINKNQAAMMAYNRRIAQTAAAQNAFITKVSGAAALVGGAALAYGIDQAAKLERAMTGVQIATGATADQYMRLRAMVLNVSGMTAQSAVTIANEMAQAGRVAFHSPQQLMTMFPMMAKYADVRYMAHGDDPVNSIERMSQFAHFFGAYTPDKMQSLLDNTAKLQFTTAAELNQLVTQGKYFIPLATKMGVPEDKIFQYLAIMGQLGFLSGRGGTSMKNLVLGAESVTPTAHLSKAKAKALHDLDLRDSSGTFRFLTKDGQLDLPDMLNFLYGKMQQFMKQDPRRGRARFTSDLIPIWGQTAAPLIASLVDKTTKEQMGRNAAAWQNIPGVQGQWEKYSKDFFYQWNTFTTNLQNLFTVTALPMLPKLTAFLASLNTGLSALVATLASNPGVANTIAMIAAGLTALFAARAGIGIISMFINGLKALGLLGSGSLMSSLLGFFRLFSLPWLGPIGIVAGALFALYQAITNGPKLIVAISNWWKKSETSITFAAGFYARRIADAVGGALQNMWSAILSIAEGFKNNWLPIMGMMLSGQGDDANALIQKIYGDAISKHQGGHNAFGAGYKAGGINQSLEHALHQSPLGGSAGLGRRGPARSGGPGLPRPYPMPQHLAPGPPYMQIHVDARGALDPMGVEKAAKRGIHAALKVANPRSMMASAAATRRTHPGIPLPLSVGFS